MTAPPPRILADENIPLVREAFGAFGPVSLLPGRAITPGDVHAADVLLVRSVTPVDATLLHGSPVRFVGSATIGTDHVNHAYLDAHDIAFAHAPGSNAGSVVEYVLAALLRVAARRDEPLRGKTVGVVGCGNIGGRLIRRLPALGCPILMNDPPLAEQALDEHSFVPLDVLLAEADIVTLHVPLTREGPHATHHLFDASILNRLKPGAWLVNTSRGPVVSGEALHDVLETNRLGATVLDVWEHEPTPDPALLRRVDLGTPHIAGHSYDGKVAGTRMLYEALCAYLRAVPAWNAEPSRPALSLTPPDATLPETAWLDALTRQMYAIEADDDRLRRLLDLPAEQHAALFSDLRKHYPRRRTFSLYTLPRRTTPAPYRDAVEHGLGVQLV